MQGVSSHFLPAAAAVTGKQAITRGVFMYVCMHFVVPFIIIIILDASL